MKALILGASAAALALLVATPASASAQADAGKPVASKCVWSQPPGPRAPLRAPVCKKVADQREQWKGTGGPECDPNYKGKTGRYVWRSRPQYGPRAPLQGPVRVWVDGTDVC